MQPWKIRLRTYLTGTWHYRWIGMGVAWAVCLIGWLVVAMVPNQFQAVSMIYVDTDTMMAPLLRDLTVSTDPQQQVSVMLNTLLARPNLEQVVHLTNPKANSLSSAELAKQVENLQDNISIKPLSTKNLFQLSFSDRDPDKGLNVAQTLLSIFVDSNIGNKRHDLEGAQSFLDTKVNEVDNAGSVNVLYGSAAGLSTANDQFWNEAAPLPGGPEAGDLFGQGHKTRWQRAAI